MGKHINFFGYSLWTSDDTQQGLNKAISPSRAFYSPVVLAAYCILINLFIGVILYGINISRRGYLWRGRLLIGLSGLLLIANVSSSMLMLLNVTQPWFLLNILIALSLYAIEKPHFQRAVRNGSKQARWWLPLVWSVVIVVALLLLQMLLV